MAHMRCKPNVKALRLGRILCSCNVIIFLTSILMFFGGDNGEILFSIICCLICWCALKEGPNVYNIDKIRCVCLIAGYLSFTQLVHSLLLMVNPKIFGMDSNSKSFNMVVFTSFFNIFFLIITSYYSKQLYDELLNYKEPEQEYQTSNRLFALQEEYVSQDVRQIQNASPHTSDSF